MTGRLPRWIWALSVVGAALLVLPVIALLARAPWGRLTGILAGEGAREALRLSIVASLGATAISVVLGIPLAWALARRRFRGRAALRAFVVLPIVLPPVVGGIGLLAALGRGGIVGGWLYDTFGLQLTFTTAGAVLAATFVSMPLVVLTAEAGFRSLDPRFEAAAATLGARPATVWLRVVLPMTASQLVAGAILAWARALGEFGATITFAGNLAGRTQTLPLVVYQARQSDPESAVALSLLLVFISIGVLVALRDRVTGAS